MNSRSKKAACIALGALGIIGTTTAFAAPPPWARAYGHYDRYQRNDEYARVLNVEPIIRRVRVSVPERQCWSEEQPVYGNSSGTVARSTLVGGLIGAAIGHQIGFREGIHSPGAVIGGSLVGAVIGNSIGVDRAERRGEYQPIGYEPTERCSINYRDDWQEKVDGYRVTYEYSGREYTTKMPYDPGRRIRVNVDVSPAARGEDCDNEDCDN